MSRVRDDSLRSNICKRMALFYLIRARSEHRILVPELPLHDNLVKCIDFR